MTATISAPSVTVATRGAQPRASSIVFGPPCAGKNYYVEANKQQGDIVIDYDAIMSTLTGLPQHTYHEPAHWYAYDAWEALVLRLSKDGYTAGKAWVIGAFVDPARMVRTVRSIRNAAAILIDPGIDTCLARAATRPNSASTEQAIRNWYAKHEGLHAGCVRG